MNEALLVGGKLEGGKERMNTSKVHSFYMHMKIE
jgi:hypothetical protein